MYSAYSHARTRTCTYTATNVLWSKICWHKQLEKELDSEKGEKHWIKVQESEAYWGVVDSFPIVSPLSKPHPTTAQAQTPKPLCAPSLSLFLFLSTPFSISPWLFLVTFFPLFLSYNLLLFPLAFCRLNHTHAVPFVCLTLLAAFVSGCSQGRDDHLSIQHRRLAATNKL